MAVTHRVHHTQRGASPFDPSRLASGTSTAKAQRAWPSTPGVRAVRASRVPLRPSLATAACRVSGLEDASRSGHAEAPVGGVRAALRALACFHSAGAPARAAAPTGRRRRSPTPPWPPPELRPTPEPSHAATPGRLALVLGAAVVRVSSRRAP